MQLWRSYSDIPALKEEEEEEAQDGPKIAICRICEEPIPLALLEEHSKYPYSLFFVFLKL